MAEITPIRLERKQINQSIYMIPEHRENRNETYPAKC